MTKQLMIYEKAVPITVAKHRDIYVKAGDSYAFAKSLNAVPVMVSEFGVASVEYAVVFAGEEQIMPAVILGVRNAENLFVGEDGTWRGNYVPAFLRQYPFVFAGAEGSDTLTLCLDESFSGVNTEGRGERLFDSEGERTTHLKNVLAFAQGYQQDFRRTQALCGRLKELDLFEPMQAQFRLPSSEVNLQGFFAVSRTKLKELADDVIGELMRSDALELIYAHLHSMQNFRRMIEFVERDSDSAGSNETKTPKKRSAGRKRATPETNGKGD